MFCNFRTSTTTDDNGGGGASGTKPTAVTTSEDSSDESPSSDSDEESEDSSEEPPVTSPNASPKVNKTLQNIVRCQFLKYPWKQYTFWKVDNFFLLCRIFYTPEQYH